MAGLCASRAAHGHVAESFQIVHMERVIQLDANVETACRNFT